ncbi:hypothetical protein Q0M04_14950, partial [Staphylococcus aureus]|nr:hypothetical protein [Staphylococcus aureus]
MTVLLKIFIVVDNFSSFLLLFDFNFFIAIYKLYILFSSFEDSVDLFEGLIVGKFEFIASDIDTHL